MLAAAGFPARLKPVENCWQPRDFLPDPSSDGFEEQVWELRERAKEIPDDYFVVLVGDMITEEALPTYQTMLNTLYGVRDERGASPTSWAIWNRAGTAEENRHGDLLNECLCTFLDESTCGKSKKRYSTSLALEWILERSVPRLHLHLIPGKSDLHFPREHSQALQRTRDLKLAQICGTITSDEKRHETAYTKIVEKLFEIGPNGTVLTFANMKRKKIAMPARLAYNGCDDNLFENFSAVSQRFGVYTAKDFADILEFLVGKWKVESLAGLSSEGRKAQEYVCGLPPRIRRL